MKLDEFAFVNQQLAGMLKSGLPLEGALRQLATSLERGDLKSELTALEADLAKGTPLRDALLPRDLPEFYKRMLVLGAQANDLPGVLLLLADYYSRVDSLWVRFKGLMVYPILVLVVASGLSVVLGLMLDTLAQSVLRDDWGSAAMQPLAGDPDRWMLLRWLPTVVLCVLTVVLLLAVSLPSVRRTLRWRLPGFKEAALAQFAAGLSMLLRGGCPLGETLGLLWQLEHGTPVADELVVWQERLAAGEGDLRELSLESRVFPPVFLALASDSGPDLAKGFRRVADTFQARALVRAETLLTTALPVAMVTLGLVVLLQLLPFGMSYLRALDGLGLGN